MTSPLFRGCLPGNRCWSCAHAYIHLDGIGWTAPLEHFALAVACQLINPHYSLYPHVASGMNPNSGSGCRDYALYPLVRMVWPAGGPQRYRWWTDDPGRWPAHLPRLMLTAPRPRLLLASPQMNRCKLDGWVA